MHIKMITINTMSNNNNIKTTNSIRVKLTIVPHILITTTKLEVMKQINLTSKQIISLKNRLYMWRRFQNSKNKSRSTQWPMILSLTWTSKTFKEWPSSGSWSKKF